MLNGNTPDANCDGSHLSTFLEEHDARGVTTASKPNAIYAFDWSRWRAQGAGFEANLRNGGTLGKLGTGDGRSNRVAPSTTTVNTTASRFLGTRYIFNVVELANHPSTYTNQLADVEKLIGVPYLASERRSGYICAGGVAATITLRRLRSASPRGHRRDRPADITLPLEPSRPLGFKRFIEGGGPGMDARPPPVAQRRSRNCG